MIDKDLSKATAVKKTIVIITFEAHKALNNLCRKKHFELPADISLT